MAHLRGAESIRIAVGSRLLLDDVTPETVDALVDLVGPGADTPMTVIDIRHLGGALTTRQGRPSAVSPPLAAE